MPHAVLPCVRTHYFAAERVCVALAAWMQATSAVGRKASVGDGLPDQLSHLDDQIGSCLTWIARCADLAGADTDRVVQPAIGLAVGQVEQ